MYIMHTLEKCTAEGNQVLVFPQTVEDIFYSEIRFHALTLLSLLILSLPLSDAP